MSRGLTAVDPVLVAEKPPKGSRQVGVTPQGKIVWEEKIVRGENVEKIDPETGMQEWELHPTTGKPLYPRRKLIKVEKTRMFTLEQDGNANLYLQPYTFPTKEELEEQRIREESERMLPALARAMVQRGVTIDKLLDKINEPEENSGPSSETLSFLEEALFSRGIQADDFVDMVLAASGGAPAAIDTPPAATTSDAPPATVTKNDAPPQEPAGKPFPRHISGGNLWLLSNEERFKGTRIEATAAEIALKGKRDIGDDVPES